MRYTNCQIVFQEVPKEISLAFSISGCSLKCDGCHSKDLWNKNNGHIMDKYILKSKIEKYSNLISCVLFYGGEWESDLIKFLDICKEYNMKTCLYTGLDDIPYDIKSKLDYLKIGKWNKNLGGLRNKNTNQKFLDLKENKDITYMFWESA